MQSSSGCIGSEEVPGRDHPDRAGVVADQEMPHVVLHMSTAASWTVVSGVQVTTSRLSRSAAVVASRS